MRMISTLATVAVVTALAASAFAGDIAIGSSANATSDQRMGGGGGSGKVSVQDISVTKRIGSVATDPIDPTRAIINTSRSNIKHPSVAVDAQTDTSTGGGTTGEQRRGGFVIPAVAVVAAPVKDDGLRDPTGKHKTISTSRSNIKYPSKEATVQSNTDADAGPAGVISTTRSNIKHPSVAVGDVNADGSAGTAINTTRSNIKH